MILNLPDFIRIFFWYFGQVPSKLRKQQSPIATENHKHNTKQCFGPKNPELLSESWTLNGNNFNFELFLGDSRRQIWDTKTLNLSRYIVSLQVLVDASRFSPCVIQLDPQQKQLSRVEEKQRSDCLICQSTSKFVACQVVSLKNEQQSQNWLLKVEHNMKCSS